MKEPVIYWRGSIGDLATDCAFLLTPEQGLELAAELKRFYDSDRLRAEKYLGKKGEGNETE
jgi:hypothetical protein